MERWPATVGGRQTRSPKRSRRGSSRSLVVEERTTWRWRLDLQEGGEDQLEAALDLLVGMLEDAPQGVADQPDRQGQGQFAALGLVEQARPSGGAKGVQLQFGDQALQTEDQPTIGSGRVVDAVLVADETAAVAAQVEELIPVGAVAGQAGDVVGEDDADLLLVDQGHEFLEAVPPFGGAAGPAEVGVDDLDPRRVPAAGRGAVLEIILEFQALLIRQDLVRARLADVDDGQATEVKGVMASEVFMEDLLEKGETSSRICCFRAGGKPDQMACGCGIGPVALLEQSEQFEKGGSGEFCAERGRWPLARLVAGQGCGAA